MKNFFVIMFISLSCVLGLRADCDCCCCHADHESCQMQEADTATIKSMLEEDPFGDQDIDDSTLVPQAPEEIIEIQQPTALQALAQRVGCILLASYLSCMDCLHSIWSKVSSLY